MSSPPTDRLLELLSRMAVIREFENVAQRLFMQGFVRGTSHLRPGQVAVAVGACAALRRLLASPGLVA